jgi:hypothetical protein
MNPKSRQTHLLIDHVGDETVVYDEERQEAHSLNRAASFVWQHSDGAHTVSQLAGLLGAELGVETSDSVVEYALDELTRVHLLESAPDGGQPVSRRDAVRRMSLAGAAAVALPVVLSIVAPTPAMAASGTQNGQGQNGNLQGTNGQ